MAKIIILFVLSGLLISCDKEPACADFLADLDLQSEHLVFEQCQKQHPAPAVVLESIYSVSGDQAKLVEDILHEKFGLKRLRFVCCYWETRHVDLVQNSIHYSINMYSDEFDGSSTQWEDFEKFYVVVQRYLVLP